ARSQRDRPPARARPAGPRGHPLVRPPDHRTRARARAGGDRGASLQRAEPRGPARDRAQRVRDQRPARPLVLDLAGALRRGARRGSARPRVRPSRAPRARGGAPHGRARRRLALGRRARRPRRAPGRRRSALSWREPREGWREPREGWLERDGTRLHYLEWRVEGAKPPQTPEAPLVPLHGLSANAHFWTRLAGPF